LRGEAAIPGFVDVFFDADVMDYGSIHMGAFDLWFGFGVKSGGMAAEGVGSHVVRGVSLDVRRESHGVRDASLGVRRESLGVRGVSLDVRRESHGVRNVSLGVRWESHEVRSVSLGVRRASHGERSLSLEVRNALHRVRNVSHEVGSTAPAVRVVADVERLETVAKVLPHGEWRRQNSAGKLKGQGRSHTERVSA
jgi:hypothetical protein